MPALIDKSGSIVDHLYTRNYLMSDSFYRQMCEHTRTHTEIECYVHQASTDHLICKWFNAVHGNNDNIIYRVLM